jgi:hypothetical protein
MMEEWNDGRMEGRREESFPQCGKLFSTVWKNPGKLFHGVEKPGPFFPQRGKLFSMVWKIMMG